MITARRWEAVWFLLVAASGLYLLSDNEADNDLWVHVRLGLEVLRAGVPRVDTWSYTAAGLPVVDHEWLLHVAFGRLFQIGGGPALLVFKLILGLATLTLLAAGVARHANAAAVRGSVLVLATAVLARGFAVRPQGISYFAIAALWVFLDRTVWRDSQRRWLLVPAFVLWANLHGGVVLGFGMAGLCAAWLILSNPRAALSLGAVVVLAMAAALVLNPYGLAYAGFLVRELGAPHPITEWQPLALEWSQATFVALGVLLVASLPLLDRWRERGWQMVLAVGLLVAACLQQRHTPVFALCAAPLVAEGFEGAVRRLRLRPLSAGAQNLLMAGLLALAGLEIVLTLQRLAGDRMQIVYEPSDYPVAAVRHLAAGASRLNLAVPLEWGGYVAWHLPDAKVSLDGRFAMVYPPEIVEDNFALFAGRDQWRRLLDEYPTQAILAHVGEVPPIAAAATWRELHRDDVAVVVVRRDVVVGEARPAVTDAGVFP